MIHFDVTKAAEGRHASGLQRVSRQLLAALGPAATPVRWVPAVPRAQVAAVTPVVMALAATAATVELAVPARHPRRLRSKVATVATAAAAVAPLARVKPETVVLAAMPATVTTV